MTIKIKNTTDRPLLFSIFNEGDNGIPYDASWIKPGSTHDMKTGTFKVVSIGVQAQEGGRWIGQDPKNTSFTVSKDNEIDASFSLEVVSKTVEVA